MSNQPVILGIDPAAPNGDHSAVAIIQGNRVHQIVFDALASKQNFNWQGSVTGRISKAYTPALHQIPKEGTMDTSPRQGYLFRKGTELIAHLDAHFLFPSDFVQGSEPGDLLLILSPGRRKKPQLYSRRASTKYLWRQLKGRDALVQQLQVLGLLQRG